MRIIIKDKGLELKSKRRFDRANAMLQLHNKHDLFQNPDLAREILDKYAPLSGLIFEGTPEEYKKQAALVHQRPINNSIIVVTDKYFDGFINNNFEFDPNKPKLPDNEVYELHVEKDASYSVESPMYKTVRSYLVNRDNGSLVEIDNSDYIEDYEFDSGMF